MSDQSYCYVACFSRTQAICCRATHTPRTVINTDNKCVPGMLIVGVVKLTTLRSGGSPTQPYVSFDAHRYASVLGPCGPFPGEIT